MKRFKTGFNLGGWLLVFSLTFILINLIGATHAQAEELVGYFDGRSSQINVLECSNLTDETISTTIKVYDHRRSKREELALNLGPRATRHLPLTKITERYGLYEIIAQSENQLSCITSIYRLTPEASPKVVEYAYAHSFLKRQSGETSGLFNRANPELGNSAAVKNVLTVVNLDSAPFNGAVVLHRKDGRVGQRISITGLGPKRIKSISLEFPDGGLTGLYRLVPENREQVYGTFLRRKGLRGTESMFAFPLEAGENYCDLAPLYISTKNNASSWVELGNASGESLSARYSIRDATGRTIKSEEIKLAKRRHRHLDVGTLLGRDKSGLFEIQCLGPNPYDRKIIVQSLLYGRRTETPARLEWARAIQAREERGYYGSQIFAPLNTYFQAANVNSLLDESLIVSNVTATIYDRSGRILAPRGYDIAAGGGKAISYQNRVGEDFIGYANLQSDSLTALYAASTARNFPHDGGGVGYVMTIPTTFLESAFADSSCNSNGRRRRNCSSSSSSLSAASSSSFSTPASSASSLRSSSTSVSSISSSSIRVSSSVSSSSASSVPANCTLANSTWQNTGFANQSGNFEAQFDITPGANNIDGVTGLSSGAAGSYSSLAAIVRLNPSGFIDARNGGVYAASAPIPYTAGTRYHLRLAVNVPAHTYSAWVSPAGGAETILASNFAFRTEQAGVTTLNNLAVIADPGAHQVCALSISASSSSSASSRSLASSSLPSSSSSLSSSSVVSSASRSSSSLSSAQSSASLSSVSGSGCSNGIQDAGELGVDCGGACPSSCPSSQILGIDLFIHGTPAKDYMVEDSYHDGRVFDEKVIYIKAQVPFGLKHNANNRKQADLEGYSTLIGLHGNNGSPDPTATTCLSNFPNNLSQCDAGMIRYKIDGDEQLRPYVRGNMSDGYDNSGRTPYYVSPISFSTLNYQPEGFPVLGKTGNNGQPYYNTVQYGGARPKYGYQGVALRTNYGQLDQFGDERHLLTFWDDDSAWNTGFALGASDGGLIHFVVNPKTPAIRFDALTQQAQYYSTPEKTYFVPKIFPRTTYLTRDVRITLTNITNSSPVWYRINTGTWQQYGAPLLSQNVFSAGVTSSLHYVFQPTSPTSGITGTVKTRTIVLDPSYPSAQETHPNNFLWDSQERLAELRVPYLGWTDTSTVNTSDVFNGFRFKTYETGRIFNAATASALSGSFGVGARAAKNMLLDAPWMHEVISLEIRGNVDNSTPNRFALFYYQGNANEVLDGILAYDLLIGQFKRANGYVDGFTAIEDHLLRDRFAAIAKNTLQFISAHEQHYSTYDPQGGTGTQHYALSAEIATAIVSMAMRSYDSVYYGTSGYDGRAATHSWTPFPNYPETWWFSVTDETSPMLLHNNPDRSTVSHMNIWMLAKNGILGTPNRDYFSTYYGTNMERMIPAFSNILHNANAPFDLTEFDWKIGDYMLCKKNNRCGNGGGYIYDPVNEYRSRWHINKHYVFARELWDYLGRPTSAQGNFAEFFFIPASVP